MIGMVVIFLILMMCITMACGAWSNASDSERIYALKVIGKVTLVAFITFAILFVVVNVF
jgi:hypothetical protein